MLNLDAAHILHTVLDDLNSCGVIRTIYSPSVVQSMNMTAISTPNGIVIVNSSPLATKAKVINVPDMSESEFQHVLDAIKGAIDSGIVSRARLASTLSNSNIPYKESIVLNRYTVSLDIKVGTTSYPETKSGICVRWLECRDKDQTYAVRVVLKTK